MVKFKKRRERDYESIDTFLDDLELLRTRSKPDERTSEWNLAIASKLMDGVKSDELKTMLATHFTLSADSVPKPDDLRMKSREYLLIKTRAQIVPAITATTVERILARNSSWYRSRDEKDKRRSWDHHISASSNCNQNIKAIDYFVDDVDATEEPS